MLDKKPAILLLQDGTFFKGTAIGAKGTAMGEIAFNTGMTGYQEVFSDPSYFGQLLIMTTSHIGNYGVHTEEVESDQVMIAGLITKKFSNGFSRPSGYQSLQNLFEEQNKIGIADVDTRSLVRHIRSKGAMNAIISSEVLDIDVLKEKLKSIPDMNGLELSSKVATQIAYDVLPTESEILYRVALLDFGVKKNIIRCLTERGCHVRVFPLTANLAEINAFLPHGYMLSNGPGDPSAMPNSIQLVRDLVATGKPIFGICLGHQLLALANGIPTFKMHHGHRGLNHPVKNLISGRSEITTQNHGFGVDPEAVKKADHIEITHVNLNDQSIEGIRVKGKPAFSVQYHPEATPGPHDSRYLFDEFIGMIQASKN